MPQATMQELAEAALKRSSYREVRALTCQFHGEDLTLTGRVPSYFHKQVAQAHLISAMAGLATLNNRLTVALP